MIVLPKVFPLNFKFHIVFFSFPEYAIQVELDRGELGNELAFAVLVQVKNYTLECFKSSASILVSEVITVRY